MQHICGDGLCNTFVVKVAGETMKMSEMVFCMHINKIAGMILCRADL